MSIGFTSALILIAVSMLGMATPASAANSPTLYFKSGFEAPVTLSAPHPTGSIAQQEFSGGDQGFNWPPKFWNGSLILQDLVSSNLDTKRYLDNHLETTTGHNGAPTTALFQKIVANENGNTQGPMYYMPTHESGDLYVKYWLKLQPDLGRVMGPHYWRSVFEFKTSGDYRFAFDVQTDANGTPYWFAHGDNNANGPYSYKEFWNVVNAGVPVPQGQWFSLEVAWHRAHDSTGRIWTAVNGQTVVDHYGSNYGVDSDPINRIMLTQVYGKVGYYQWVDDMEIWNGVPPSGATSGATSAAVSKPATTSTLSVAPAKPVTVQPTSQPQATPQLPATPQSANPPKAAPSTTRTGPSAPSWQSRLSGFWHWIFLHNIHFWPFPAGPTRRY